jgi:hypothetical protein
MRISETEEYKAKMATYFICACGKEITLRFIYTAKYEMNNWNITFSVLNKMYMCSLIC